MAVPFLVLLNVAPTVLRVLSESTSVLAAVVAEVEEVGVVLQILA